MGTLYPEALDSFPEFLQTSLEQNSGEWWNPLMDAAEAVQAEGGAGLGGSLADLTAFLDEQMEGDGSLLAFDFGTITGTPTAASPLTITFGKTFATAPLVFVHARIDMTANTQGVICGVQNVTTTTCQLVSYGKNGTTTPTASLTYHYWAVDGSVNDNLS